VIDKTDMEQRAIKDARRPFAEALTELGLMEHFFDLTAEQIDQLIEAAVDGFQQSMQAQVKRGLRQSKPIYAAQCQLYMAYMQLEVTIDQAMHDAGQDFQAAFIIAQLDPLRALPMLRVPGTGREPDLSERQLHARRQVHQAMAALGGISSPAGSCVWHVVGLQRSVREWAMRQGWGGRPVRQEQAQGILVAALGVLAGHFGYDEAKRAS
jgi:Family of unknown function (DUF6511)